MSVIAPVRSPSDLQTASTGIADPDLLRTDLAKKVEYPHQGRRACYLDHRDQYRLLSPACVRVHVGDRESDDLAFVLQPDPAVCRPVAGLAVHPRWHQDPAAVVALPAPELLLPQAPQETRGRHPRAPSVPQVCLVPCQEVLLAPDILWGYLNPRIVRDLRAQAFLPPLSSAICVS
jgi:hypothetical protein